MFTRSNETRPLTRLKANMMKLWNKVDLWKYKQGLRRETKLQASEIQWKALRAEHTETFKSAFLCSLLHRHESESQHRLSWGGEGDFHGFGRSRKTSPQPVWRRSGHAFAPPPPSGESPSRAQLCSAWLSMAQHGVVKLVMEIKSTRHRLRCQKVPLEKSY